MNGSNAVISSMSGGLQLHTYASSHYPPNCCSIVLYHLSMAGVKMMMVVYFRSHLGLGTAQSLLAMHLSTSSQSIAS